MGRAASANALPAATGGCICRCARSSDDRRPRHTNPAQPHQHRVSRLERSVEQARLFPGISHRRLAVRGAARSDDAGKHLAAIAGWRSQLVCAPALRRGIRRHGDVRPGGLYLVDRPGGHELRSPRSVLPAAAGDQRPGAVPHFGWRRDVDRAAGQWHPHRRRLFPRLAARLDRFDLTGGRPRPRSAVRDRRRRQDLEAGGAAAAVGADELGLRRRQLPRDLQRPPARLVSRQRRAVHHSGRRAIVASVVPARGLLLDTDLLAARVRRPGRHPAGGLPRSKRAGQRHGKPDLPVRHPRRRRHVGYSPIRARRVRASRRRLVDHNPRPTAHLADESIAHCR